MQRGIVVALLLGAVALASIAVGCGGGDEDPPTKAEFTRQAEKICRQAEQERAKATEAAFKRVADAGKTMTPAAQEQVIVDDALPPVVAMVEELDELQAPEGDEERFQAIVDAYGDAIAVVQINPKRALTETRQIFHEPHKLARAYGFDYCAKA